MTYFLLKAPLNPNQPTNLRVHVAYGLSLVAELISFKLLTLYLRCWFAQEKSNSINYSFP